jgi:putative membrane protein
MSFSCRGRRSWCRDSAISLADVAHLHQQAVDGRPVQCNSGAGPPMDTSTSPPPASPRKSSDELAQIRTDLAMDRTLMAADRSLMAWVRTGLSMISFGFTIYKILEGMQEEGHRFRLDMPRNVGLFLSGVGTIAMVMGTIEFWIRLKALRKERSYRIAQPSLVMALVMSSAGLFIFIGIVLRLF